MTENRTICWNGLTRTRSCDDDEANNRHALADAARDGEWRRDRIVVHKILIIKTVIGNLAERVGFEPTVPVRAHRFSRPACSTSSSTSPLECGDTPENRSRHRVPVSRYAFFRRKS